MAAGNRRINDEAPDLAGAPQSRPASDATRETRRILVGRFGAAHGVRGEIRLQSFTQNPRSIGKLKPLTDVAGARVFVVQSLRHVRDNLFVAQVAGCADRSAAETLCNLELYVPRERLPKAAPDEFYVADLVGLDAISADGVRLGVVVNAPNYGAGDLLEIKPPHGETLLIAFTRANVPRIDMETRQVAIVLPQEVEASDEAIEEPH